MVISNLNTARIIDLIRFIERCTEELKPFSKMTEKEFLSDKKNPPVLTNMPDFDRFNTEILAFIRSYDEKRPPEK